ncbi:hypothetical protein Rs2_21256 [Raphanus sativus]|nr:hypothetical protein Rs2_21256 [Raphanus sativus]
MAFNLTHQLGSLAGTPIQSGEMTAPTVESSLSVSPPSARMPISMNMNYNTNRNVSPPMSPVLGARRADLSVAVTMGNTVNRRKAMRASLQALKSAGVEGIMIDVWGVWWREKLLGLITGEVIMSCLRWRRRLD